MLEVSISHGKPRVIKQFIMIAQHQLYTTPSEDLEKSLHLAFEDLKCGNFLVSTSRRIMPLAGELFA
jgi:hypothetical protein